MNYETSKTFHEHKNDKVSNKCNINQKLKREIVVLMKGVALKKKNNFPV